MHALREPRAGRPIAVVRWACLAPYEMPEPSRCAPCGSARYISLIFLGCAAKSQRSRLPLQSRGGCQAASFRWQHVCAVKVATQAIGRSKPISLCNCGNARARSPSQSACRASRLQDELPASRKWRGGVGRHFHKAVQAGLRSKLVCISQLLAFASGQREPVLMRVRGAMRASEARGRKCGCNVGHDTPRVLHRVSTSGTPAPPLRMCQRQPSFGWW
jgi:hypothetical protein